MEYGVEQRAGRSGLGRRGRPLHHFQLLGHSDYINSGAHGRIVGLPAHATFTLVRKKTRRIFVVFDILLLLFVGSSFRANSTPGSGTRSSRSRSRPSWMPRHLRQMNK